MGEGQSTSVRSEAADKDLRQDLRALLLGSLLVMLDFRIGRFDLLPNFIGYALIALFLARVAPANRKLSIALVLARLLTFLSIPEIYDFRLGVEFPQAGLVWLWLPTFLALLPYYAMKIGLIVFVCLGLRELAKRHGLTILAGRATWALVLCILCSAAVAFAVRSADVMTAVIAAFACGAVAIIAWAQMALRARREMLLMDLAAGASPVAMNRKRLVLSIAGVWVLIIAVDWALVLPACQSRYIDALTTEVESFQVVPLIHVQNGPLLVTAASRWAEEPARQAVERLSAMIGHGRLTPPQTERALAAIFTPYTRAGGDHPSDDDADPSQRLEVTYWHSPNEWQGSARRLPALQGDEVYIIDYTITPKPLISPFADFPWSFLPRQAGSGSFSRRLVVPVRLAGSRATLSEARSAAASQPAVTAPLPNPERMPLWDDTEELADHAQRAGIKSRSLELRLDGNVTMKMVLIPSGEFEMGSEDGLNDERPPHPVAISRPFYMAMYHVTRGQFAAFIADSSYRTDAERGGHSQGWDGVSGWRELLRLTWKKPGFTQTEMHPVVCISHNDAVAFCEWLSRKAGRTITLPTEAQWEFACRGGTDANPSGRYLVDGGAWCNGADQACRRALRIGTDYFAWDDGFAFTSPVGSFLPNYFGLFDMQGNAMQWCSDWYGKDYYANCDPLDPAGPPTGSRRVMRGGAWCSLAQVTRLTYRAQAAPDERADYYGFRVVAALTHDDLARPKPRPSYREPSVAAYASKAEIPMEITLPLEFNVTMKLTLIPPGKFDMGSAEGDVRHHDESPQHEVVISQPFYMGTHEVTQEQYQAVMGYNPSSIRRPANPVEQVSWNDAMAFCEKLSANTRKAVRLPTEAQWEYACRAGTATPFSTGENLSSRRANLSGGWTDADGVHGRNRCRPVAVGMFAPNSLGLHDMHGNVLEWCSDWYGEGYYSTSDAADPAGPASGSLHVVRGGWWGSSPTRCRSAAREGALPDARLRFIGFRVIVELSPGQTP